MRMYEQKTVSSKEIRELGKFSVKDFKFLNNYLVDIDMEVKPLTIFLKCIRAGKFTLLLELNFEPSKDDDGFIYHDLFYSFYILAPKKEFMNKAIAYEISSEIWWEINGNWRNGDKLLKCNKLRLVDVSRNIELIRSNGFSAVDDLFNNFNTPQENELVNHLIRYSES